MVCCVASERLTAWLANALLVAWLVDRRPNWQPGSLIGWLMDKLSALLTDWTDWVPAWLASYLDAWLTVCLLVWLLDWLPCWLTSRLTLCLTECYACWLIAYWLAAWLADWLTDWLPDWLTDWLNESMTDKCSPDWDTEARLVSWLAGVLFDRLTDLLTNFSTIFGSVIVLFFDLFQIQREKTARIRKAEENFHFGSEINVQWNLIYCNLCCEKNFICRYNHPYHQYIFS